MPQPMIPAHSLQFRRFGTSHSVVSFNGEAVGCFLNSGSTVLGRPGLRFQHGSISNGGFYAWINAARFGHVERRRVAITEFDASGRRVRSYALRNAWPMKWTGPALAAKGSSDVAIEELVLAHEGIELE